MKRWGLGEDTASMEHSGGKKRHSDPQLLDIECLERAGRGKSKKQRGWREWARAVWNDVSLKARSSSPQKREQVAV